MQKYNNIRNILVGLILSVIIFSSTAVASPVLFVSDECVHCDSLKEQLFSKNLYEKYEIEEREIFYNKENALLYLEKSKEVGYKGGGVPLLIDGEVYVEGTDSILEYLSDRNNASEGLSKEDSTTLNEMMRAATISSPDKDREPTSEEKLKSYNKIIGVLVIILGLSMFIRMIQRALKKPRK